MKFVNIFKLQTYRNKAILSRGIANQRARGMGAWEEEEQGCINCRKVDLPPPHMNFMSLDTVGEDSCFLCPLSRTSPLHLAFLCTI